MTYAIKSKVRLVTIFNHLKINYSKLISFYFYYKDTNENLQVMLTERDDIYMQQDSYLVDIEDVSK